MFSGVTGAKGAGVQYRKFSTVQNRKYWLDKTMVGRFS